MFAWVYIGYISISLYVQYNIQGVSMNDKG